MATVPTARERLCFLADLLRELRLSTSLSTSTGTRNHSTMNGRIDEGLDHVAALLLREPPSPPEDEPPPGWELTPNEFLAVDFLNIDYERL